eukprot:TRINITY_DN16499_c0_g1_i1.p1 TRINITY_DN16499_c0_g1~~TRINITY_DN16499_c0_g1_i1.p1  ORF type:complete len:157 (+),score=23.66 TRINITY_DN16499_c0_g1_i1:49-519(+)
MSEEEHKSLVEEEKDDETEIEIQIEEEAKDREEPTPEAEGYYSASPEWYEVPFKYEVVEKTWRAVYPVLYQMYATADYLGEKVADALGITQSRFQYAIDEHDRQLARKTKKEAYIKKKLLEERAKERRRLGLPDPNAKATSMPHTSLVHVQPEESV